MRNFVVCGQCGAVVLSSSVTVRQHEIWHKRIGEAPSVAHAAFSLLEASDFPGTKFRSP